MNRTRTLIAVVAVAIVSLFATSCLGDQTYVYYSCGIVDWSGDENALETAGNYLVGKGAAFGTISFQDVDGQTLQDVYANSDAMAQMQFSSLALGFDVDELTELLDGQQVSFTYCWARANEASDGVTYVYVGKWSYPSGTIE